MPEDYIRPKQKSGHLARACRVNDVCGRCEAAGRRVDVSGILLAAWRAAARQPAEEHSPGDPLSVGKRCIAETAVTDRSRTEKLDILERLKRYRKEHGLGCLADVAKKAGRGITDDTLRSALQGNITLDIREWRQISKALDRLAAPSEGNGE